MIELGKYGSNVLLAYGVTITIIIIHSAQTFIEFIKTKNKLAKISQKKSPKR